MPLVDLTRVYLKSIGHVRTDEMKLQKHRNCHPTCKYPTLQCSNKFLIQK
jgi:hypothetical protein